MWTRTRESPVDSKCGAKLEAMLVCNSMEKGGIFVGGMVHGFVKKRGVFKSKENSMERGGVKSFLAD